MTKYTCKRCKTETWTKYSLAMCPYCGNRRFDAEVIIKRKKKKEYKDVDI